MVVAVVSYRRAAWRMLGSSSPAASIPDAMRFRDVAADLQVPGHVPGCYRRGCNVVSRPGRVRRCAVRLCTDLYYFSEEAA